jgi:hypothetical protein
MKKGHSPWFWFISFLGLGYYLQKRKPMESYLSPFSDSLNKKISSSDLVSFTLVHWSRKNIYLVQVYPFFWPID